MAGFQNPLLQFRAGTIDGKTIGNTVITTLNMDPNTRIWPIAIVITSRNLFIVTTPPIVSVGKTSAAYDDILGATTLPTLTANRFCVVLLPKSNATTLADNEALTVRVSTAAVATTYDFAVDVLGYQDADLA